MWSYQRIIVTGDPNISLGKIANVNGDNISTQSSGIWTIQGVTHVLAKPDEMSRVLNYTCELDVARNDPKTQVFNSNSKMSAFSTNVLRNGMTWESSMMGEFYV